jgi:hypothetical protein
MTKRLLPTTSLNDAIRRVAEGHTGAASVIAMLNSRRPQNVMAYLHSLDNKQVYGNAVYDMYWNDCGGNFDRFVIKLSE